MSEWFSSKMCTSLIETNNYKFHELKTQIIHDRRKFISAIETTEYLSI